MSQEAGARNPEPTPVSIIELQEFGFAMTAAEYTTREGPAKGAMHIRESLRLHRFIVMGWLMQNGVRLPVELVNDHAHPLVGQQSVDKPCPPPLCQEG